MNTTMTNQLNADLTEFQKKLYNLCEALKAWEGYTDIDLWTKLKATAQDVLKKHDDVMKHDRDLKLGIVGRVKAGKSSFLNALLFEGEDILPKAATPMTAALTHITYAESLEEQKAVVHYYSRGDWGIVVKKDEEYRKIFQERIQEALNVRQNSPRARAQTAPREVILQELKQAIARGMPEELRVCHELVEMAKKTVSFEDLPRTQGRDDAHEFPFSKNMIADLKEYVAAEGKYTPMVKYLELKVHNKGLLGFEVTDTPGLNDPVTSRVNVTNKFLKECDAVLLLSSVSRFLDREDYNLVQDLKHAGVQEVYIIGTMFDLGILQYPAKNVSLQQAYTGSKRNYTEQFLNFISRLAAEYKLPNRLQNNFEEFELSSELSSKKMKKLDVKFVSSQIFSIAKKKESEKLLNKSEEHILKNIANQFADYKETLTSAEDFYTLAGFKAIQDKIYEPISIHKEEIIKKKIDNFEKTQAGDICSRLEDLVISAQGDKSKLENGDAASFKKDAACIQESLQSSRIAVRNIFKDYSINAQKALRPLKMNLRTIMNGHKKVKENIEVKTRTWSDGFFIKNFHSETYTVHTAQANDAAENIEQYAQDALRLIHETLDDILDSSTLENALRNAIYETFSDAKIDVRKNTDIVGPIQELVEKLLMIPRPQFDYSDVAKKQILGKFSSQVRDEEIYRLKTIQNEQLDSLYTQYSKDIDSLIINVKSALEQHASVFIDSVCGKVNDKYAELTKKLQDKENNINLYEKAIKDMTDIKQGFAGIGN